MPWILKLSTNEFCVCTHTDFNTFLNAILACNKWHCIYELKSISPPFFHLERIPFHFVSCSFIRFGITLISVDYFRIWVKIPRGSNLKVGTLYACLALFVICSPQQDGSNNNMTTWHDLQNQIKWRRVSQIEFKIKLLKIFRLRN